MSTSCIAGGQAIKSFGVKLGVSTATQTWESGQRIDQLTGFRWGADLGGYVEWSDTPVFSILSEIHYIQKGMNYRVYTAPTPAPNGTWEYYSANPRIDYLSIPLLAKLRCILGQTQVYALLGPRLDLLLKQDGDGFSLFAQNKSTDFGVTIGAGVQTSLASLLEAGVEFRYSPGFVDEHPENFSVRNRSFELLLLVGK